MSTEEQIQAFAHTLTEKERRDLWSHVHRYAGLDGTTAKEQFGRLIEYVLNFYDPESTIYQKALKML